jgi:hypothetical protein
MSRTKKNLAIFEKEIVPEQIAEAMKLVPEMFARNEANRNGCEELRSESIPGMTPLLTKLKIAM